MGGARCMYWDWLTSLERWVGGGRGGCRVKEPSSIVFQASGSISIELDTCITVLNVMISAGVHGTFTCSLG